MAPRKPRATNGNGNGKSVTPVEELIMIATPEKIEIPANINIGFANILDDEPDLTFEEACKLSGCLTPYELQEYLESLLPDLDVWGLKTIPACYMPQLAEIKRSIEAQNTVKKLEAESSAQQFQAPEIPLIDEPIPQPESSAIALTEPSQVAQGHAEQLQERLNLENYAREAEQGVRELAIETAIQKVDNLSEDIKNAVLQRVAQKKAELFEEIGESLLTEFMAETNSQLAKPTVYTEIQKQNEERKPAFLSKLEAAREAFKNRNTPSEIAS